MNQNENMNNNNIEFNNQNINNNFHELENSNYNVQTIDSASRQSSQIIEKSIPSINNQTSNKKIE